jgi:antitoxin component of MazEF toxin-antitoxin module
MIKGITRIVHSGSSGVIIVPAKILSDSQFPFILGESVKIEVVDEKLVLEKIKK